MFMVFVLGESEATADEECIIKETHISNAYVFEVRMIAGACVVSETVLLLLTVYQSECNVNAMLACWYSLNISVTSNDVSNHRRIQQPMESEDESAASTGRCWKRIVALFDTFLKRVSERTVRERLRHFAT